jgi:gliding motility-associated-like protein
MPYEYKLGSGSYGSSGTFGSLVAGSYTVTVRDAVLSIVPVAITITEPTELKVTATTVPVSCPSNSDGSITITPSGGTPSYTALWSDGATAMQRNNLLTGTYNVIVTDANGCSVNSSVVIEATGSKECIEVQEIITPNGDGFYDTWNIKNIELFPEAEVQVFNRWGQKVFTSRNISADDWDGTVDGKPLPMDSYHYILYLSKDSNPIKGTITIIR